MDVVTQSLLNEFAASQKIDGQPLSDQFEAFVNYIVVSDLYSEEFDIGLIGTGEGEFGIDGIAIIVNDVIIEDEEQLEDIISHSVALQAQFVFVQSKTTSSFDCGDMSKFFHAVLDFFKKEAQFQQSQRILELQHIKNRLYASAAKFVRGLPKTTLFYATTGTWAEDKNLCAISRWLPGSGKLIAHVFFSSVSSTRCGSYTEALLSNKERFSDLNQL